jgi:dTDP-glucose 4,6-dehydratase
MVGPYLPLDAHFAIGNFIRDAINRQPVIIQGDGAAIRSYLYLSDVVSRLWLLLFHGESKAYNVGSPFPISILDLAHFVVKVLKSDSHIKIKRHHITQAHSDHYVPNVSLLEKKLRIKSYIPLNQAILKTANWNLIK